ncbi:MAG: HAD-IIIA family hydrolase [Eubacteriales bacterium]|nr:HAD-IIIA family hydrolase [Eubacteriales bacterium]
MKAVIMAGGKGTRIRSVASDIPKPMIPVLDKPVLEYQIENLKKCGITEIILVTGYLNESVSSYFGNGESFGVDISYFNEDTAMGTAGALYYLRQDGRLNEDFLLIMGDLMLSVDFVRFMNAHKSSGAGITLFVHPNSHPFDSDIVVTDEVGRLSDFTEDKCGLNAVIKHKTPGLSKPVTGIISKKAERGEHFYYHNQVNAGIYAISPRVAKLVAEPKEKIDLDKDIVRPLIEKGEVYAYRSTEYVKDMGTPERYNEVTEAVRTGAVERRNLTNRQRCVFLDRDGTVNVEKGFLNNAEDMELLPGAADAIRKLNASEYLTVLITNQPVIARGECSFEGLDEIQKKFDTLLGREGAYIDAVYYCPHHPHSGFEGEVKELKFECRCRKGRSGMIEDAVRELNIDSTSSWMVGDKTSDVECGKGAGCRTVLLQTGANGSDGRFDEPADLVCRNLAEAVDKILKA